MTVDNATNAGVEAIRSSCPLTTDKSYEAAGGCGIAADGSDCSMAGIAGGCVFNRHNATYARKEEG